MTRHDDHADLHGGRMRVPRSRGAFSGVLLVVLGAWGALIPFVGPYFHFGFTPDSSFTMTHARFWLELLPGVVTAVGGLLLLVAANRVIASLGGWLAVAGGAWFVVGPTLDRLLHLGSIGSPIRPSTLRSTLESLLLFTGLGAVILFLGALAVGRLGLVGVRDVRAAQRSEQNRAQQSSYDESTAHTTAVHPDRGTTDRRIDDGRQQGADGYDPAAATRADGTDVR